MTNSLSRLLEDATRRFADRDALVEPDGRVVSYGDLQERAQAVAQLLREAGVRPGDRVGLCLDKSADAVAALFGALFCGAAYVPVDATGPLRRAAFMLADCRVRAVVAERRLLDPLRIELARADHPAALIGREAGRFHPPRIVPPVRAASGRRAGIRGGASRAGLACILYTSGSTGDPKGVMLTHRNAGSFVDWCSQAFGPAETDRFSSHAPFHFDLSILDLFLSIKHGACTVLFDAAQAADPRLLAREIDRRGITLWYSTPSVLQAMDAHGRMERHAYDRLHTVLFAGEVFPPEAFESWRRRVPLVRHFNLYGPTETNVCTFHEIPDRRAGERAEPLPIGRPCAHVTHRVAGRGGRRVGRGEGGELLIRGPGVTPGYWNRPALNRRAFHEDSGGRRWYRTGDLVREGEDGLLRFLGRRDRMVKKRGYRVELGEIERCLSGYEQIESAATVALAARGPKGAGPRIAAFYVPRPGREVSPLRLREYVGGALPAWMMPDEFVGVPELPRTSTHKTDYRRLQEMLP